MEKKRFVIVLDLALIGLSLAAVPVTGWMFDVLPDCPMAKLGILCPSCGGTRCVRYFFGGRFADAFAVHPVIFLLIVYLGIAVALLNVGVLLKMERVERIARAMTGWQAVIVCTVLFVVFGVIRNIAR